MTVARTLRALITLYLLLNPALAARSALAAPEAAEQRPRQRAHEGPPPMPRLRVVLKDVLYRSGTPTEEALGQMCQNGWKRAYSLYGERTSSHGPRNQTMAANGVDERRCVSEGRERVLEWRSAPSSRQRSLPRIFQDIVDSVRDPRQGPVLVHCWNGLHYAGMISAMALRQFCGLSADEAEAYWWSTTLQGQNYPAIPKHIHDFQPMAGYSLTAAERARICPPQKKSITLAGVWRSTLTKIPGKQQAEMAQQGQAVPR